MNHRKIVNSGVKKGIFTSVGFEFISDWLAIRSAQFSRPNYRSARSSLSHQSSSRSTRFHSFFHLSLHFTFSILHFFPPSSSSSSSFSFSLDFLWFSLSSSFNHWLSRPVTVTWNYHLFLIDCEMISRISSINSFDRGKMDFIIEKWKLIFLIKWMIELLFDFFLFLIQTFFIVLNINFVLLSYCFIIIFISFHLIVLLFSFGFLESAVN